MRYRRCAILPLSSFILAGVACALGMEDRGGDGADASVFRANPGHTGAYEAPGAPQLHGLVWKSMVEGRQCPAAVGEGVLIAERSVYPGLRAFDIQTGKTLWDFPTGVFNGSPAIAGGAVYASYSNGTVKGGGLQIEKSSNHP